MNVMFTPQVEDDIMSLVDLLIDNGYLGDKRFAISYVDEFIDYIESSIELLPHKDAPSFFRKYGTDLKYIMYNRSHNTTWYILFECRENAYLVKYITNNHYEGQYFNV